ncbi:unnamed protein product [Urochloa humidicola]
MAAVASNRADSATILLALLVTGWCMAMASAVPVANGRRLQQLAASSDLLRRPLLTPTRIYTSYEPESQRLVQVLRNHVVVTKMQVSLIEDPRFVNGCPTMKRFIVSGAISDLRSQLKSTTAGRLPISMQPIALMINLLDLEGLVVPCPGLRAILGNGQGILTTLRELLAAIQ